MQTRFVKVETSFGPATTLPILSAADMMVCGGVAEMIHPAAMQRLLMS